MESKKLLKYLKQGLDELLERGCFESGHTFKTSQKEALEALQADLRNSKLTIKEKLKGYYNIATGLGKTGLASGILSETLRVAERNGDQLKMIMVVPTNQLLEQTPRDLIKFSPSLKKKIGLCGNGHDDLSQPLTVMNVDAWDEKSDAGLIGAHNVDFLLTDEGHRSTSTRRIERLNEKFNGHAKLVIQIAVTATSHFDQEKSVEKTHKRLIYAKRLHEAIRGGEGAAYIQAQPVIIRVEPDEYMLSKAFQNASSQKTADYRFSLIAKAYNEAVLEVYRDGIDEHTGDPLSDNQGAFFCRRTRQADDLAKMLNDDSVLQKKAKKLGHKSVAIAIHTDGLSDKEQKKRFKAVQKQNKYLSIVGDSKFKEGFDHPPIKNIFDMPRKSLVDKEQILGRGGREWYNKEKGRYEGLTVFDPVIYIGSDDPKEDEKLLKKALAKATSVESILEDTCVLGPEAPKGYRIRLFSKKEGFSKLAHSTIALKKLNKNLFHMRILNQHGHSMDYTELDKDLIKELDNLFVNPQLLEKQSYHQQLAKEIRLSVGHLEPEFKGRRKRKPFEGNPNVTYYTNFGDIYRLEQEKSKLRREDWTDITNEARHELQAHAKRTGLGGFAIYNRIKTPPEGLDAAQARYIISGQTKIVPLLWVKALLDTYQDQSDSKASPISPEDAAELKSQAERTGLGGRAIWNKIKEPPKGLTPGKAASVIAKDQKSAPPSWTKALLDIYKQQPDAKATEKPEPISPEDVAELKSQSERTRLGGAAIWSKIKEPPKGLEKKNISNVTPNIISGKRTSAPPSWVRTLINVYKQQPDAKVAEKYEPISPKDKAKLKSQVERTGLGGTAIWNQMEDPPNGLDTKKADSIVYRIIAGGGISAPPSWTKALLDTYKQQPNTEVTEKPVPISPKDKAKLKSEAERTGLGGVAILRKITSPPKGLKETKVGNVVAGNQKSAPPSWIRTLINAYKTQPTQKTKPSGTDYTNPMP